MNQKEQELHFNQMVETMRSIMLKKGNDYSNVDRLSNFKYGGGIIGISPEQHCLALIATKVARLGNLLSSGKTPDNESVDDSIVDMANYSLLLSMIVADSRKQKELKPLLNMDAFKSELEIAKDRIIKMLAVPDVEFPLGEMEGGDDE